MGRTSDAGTDGRLARLGLGYRLRPGLLGGLLETPTLQRLDAGEVRDQGTAGMKDFIAPLPELTAALLTPDLDIGQGAPAVVHQRRELILAVASHLPEGSQTATECPSGLADLILVDHDPVLRLVRPLSGRCWGDCRRPRTVLTTSPFQ